MSPITARYRWTVETLMTGQRHAAKYTRGLLVFRIVLAVAVVALGLLFLLEEKLSPLTGGAIIASSVGLGLLIGKILKSSRTRRQFAQRPDANQEVT